MSSKAMSLKARIKNCAKSNNITAQVVLQNYMFERFLERLSKSDYSEKFVVKGGLLIAAIVGLDTRTTMDLDTTLKNLPLTEEKVKEAVNSICTIDLDNELRISLWGYNIETVMAEKVETILSRGVFSTRPRDLYDIYILGTTQKYDKALFAKALKATAVHRGSDGIIADTQKIISLLYDSEEQKDMWEKYQKKFPYAKDIFYEQAVKELEKLISN